MGEYAFKKGLAALTAMQKIHNELLHYGCSEPSQPVDSRCADEIRRIVRAYYGMGDG